MIFFFQEGVKYKSVNTYSGWTSATRHKYQTVKVKMVKSTAKETLIERLKPPPESEEKEEEKDKEVNKLFLLSAMCATFPNCPYFDQCFFVSN